MPTAAEFEKELLERINPVWVLPQAGGGKRPPREIDVFLNVFDTGTRWTGGGALRRAALMGFANTVRSAAPEIQAVQ